MRKQCCERCGFEAHYLRPTRRADGIVMRACEECALDLECDKAHATHTYCPKHGEPVAAKVGAA